MAKEADAWTPMLAEINKYIYRQGICPVCFKKGHIHRITPQRDPLTNIFDKVLRHPTSGPILIWKNGERKGANRESPGEKKQFSILRLGKWLYQYIVCIAKVGNTICGTVWITSLMNKTKATI
ncbi:10031_t:CDS:1, partial [Paraglomus brasilianum]